VTLALPVVFAKGCNESTCVIMSSGIALAEPVAHNPLQPKDNKLNKLHERC
jgi:hypothetical protein